MQLTNAPGKLTLPFANGGGKNTIPAASQIGVTPGAASLVDGFPPLTRTPLASGGVPPSGLDMNGILYAVSAIARWAAAGGSFVYDSAFAADSNVSGYPKGASVLRSDGLGFWINTVDANTADPEAGGAGWVPGMVNGVTTVAMTNANVTLTPLQYGKPIIVITGTLTANLQLIFPAIAGKWSVINSTTGAYSITAKTASGGGVTIIGADEIVCDGTNVKSIATAAAASVGVPVGATIYVPGNTAPAGFIKKNGALLTRASYPALWAFAQASNNLAATDGAWTAGQFSPGDGSTTFRIPDGRGEFVRGWDDSRGVDSGRAIGSDQSSQNLSHSHGLGPWYHTYGAGTSDTGPMWGGGGSVFNNQASSTNADGGTEARPRNIAELACIKY
jgi:microcystin-dependent protein